MKSQKAKEFIDELMEHIRISMFDEHDRQLAKVEIGDHAKEQLRLAMTHAVDLAEQEAEERMRENAIEAFCASNCPKGCSFVADGNIGCGAMGRFLQKLM